MGDGWQAVSSMPPLAAGELQIWRVDLTEAAESVGIFQQLLSSEERERAERMRAKQVRIQFVVARACLRLLLANLLRIEPVEVPIQLNNYGKPETTTINGKPLYFNVAHSRETLLIALCRESPVGIDLEYLDRKTDALEIARRFFTEGECRQIEAAGDPEQQLKAFFRCWTRKEAVVKADGRGLSLPLTSFEVPVSSNAKSVSARIAEASVEPDGGIADWYVSDLALGEAIAGAFAVALPGLRPRVFTFPLRPVPKATPNA